MPDAGGQGRRYAFVFVCQSGELEIKALLLAASLRRFLRCAHELIAAIPEPEGVFGAVRPLTRRLLAALGVRTVPIVNEIDPAYRIGNKISCLRVSTSASKLVFLDSDILCMREFRDESRFAIAFNAKPADVATFGSSVEAWQPIYALFDLPVPDRRVRSTVAGEYMPPYFNAGFIAVTTATRFGDVWLECCRRIHAASLPFRQRLLDQVGLAVALRKSALAFDCLDDRYNHPAHLVPLDPRRRPFFCHYHWPAVIRREPSMLELMRSLLEEWPDIRRAMEGEPEWETVLRRVSGPRPRWRDRWRPRPIATPDLLITGMPRSGTSYLCNLLHRFEDCVALNEPAEIFGPLVEQATPWGVATFLRDVRRDILEGRPIANKLRAGRVVEDTLEVAQRSEYAPSVGRADFVLAVKNTLAFLNRLDSLRRVLPEARVVACVRDPFETIASWKRSFGHLNTADVETIPVGHLNDPWLGPRQRSALQAVASMPTAAERRAAYWRYLAELIRDHADRLVIVRYQDLVREPMAVLGRVLEGWRPGRLREPILPSPGRGRLDLLDEDDRQAIRAICSDVAIALGVYPEDETLSGKGSDPAPEQRSREAGPVLAGARYFRSPRHPEPRDVSDLFARSLAESSRRSGEFLTVERYCMFVGYPRSGHSLVGSLLDAHPDVAIAHELDALGYFEAGFSVPQIYWLILDKDRAFTESGREWMGYRYVVSNQWQGRVRKLRVIGDKKGGSSTLRCQEKPDLLPMFRRAVGVPLKLIHVVRNPYDNISTIFRRQQQPTLAASIDWYFSMCDTVSRVMEDAEDGSLTTLRLEALVSDAKAVLADLCAFLGVEGSAEYLNDCADLVWASPQRTREDAGWTAEEIARVRERMKRFPYLDGYGFEG